MVCRENSVALSLYRVDWWWPKAGGKGLYHGSIKKRFALNTGGVCEEKNENSPQAKRNLASQAKRKWSFQGCIGRRSVNHSPPSWYSASQAKRNSASPITEPTWFMYPASLKKGLEFSTNPADVKKDTFHPVDVRLAEIGIVGAWKYDYVVNNWYSVHIVVSIIKNVCWADGWPWMDRITCSSVDCPLFHDSVASPIALMRFWRSLGLPSLHPRIIPK